MACSEPIATIAEPIVVTAELFRVVGAHQMTIRSSRIVVTEPPMVVAGAKMT
jgi:hypothetical protein